MEPASPALEVDSLPAKLPEMPPYWLYFLAVVIGHWLVLILILKSFKFKRLFSLNYFSNLVVKTTKKGKQNNDIHYHNFVSVGTERRINIY